MSFVGYSHLLTPELPPLAATKALEYWTASNGIWLRAKREGVEAIIPVAPAPVPIKGLFPLTPQILLEYPRVDQHLMAELLIQAMETRDPTSGSVLEILFHLHGQHNGWKVTLPEQDRGQARVTPTIHYDTGPVPLIDLHSHGTMPCFFSATDDRDAQGFRFDAVLGNIFERPTLLMRLSIYGHFYPLPARTLFDLPPFIADGQNEWGGLPVGRKEGRAQ